MSAEKVYELWKHRTGELYVATSKNGETTGVHGPLRYRDVRTWHNDPECVDYTTNAVKWFNDTSGMELIYVSNHWNNPEFEELLKEIE